MTRPAPRRRGEASRALDLLANTGAAAAYLSLFVTLRRLVIGRRLTVRTRGGVLALTIDALVSQLGVRGIAAGRLDDIRLTAHDVYWNGHRLDRAVVVLHDVRLRGTRPPVLVAARVELTVDVPPDTLDEVIRRTAPRYSGRVDADGVATVGLARRPIAGRLEIGARLSDGTLWLLPRAIVRRRRWPLFARLPGYPVRLPDLPSGLRISAVELLPGTVRVTGELPHWQADMPRTRLENVIAQLSAVGLPLDLIWPNR